MPDPVHPGPDDSWSGPRPLVSGAPVAVAIAAGIVLVVVLVIALRRDMGLPALVSQQYVDVMAGTLTPTIETADGGHLTEHFAADGTLGFVPQVGSLEPAFSLTGGTAHQIGHRRAAVWFYRDDLAETLLAHAFAGGLEELGPPDELRDERPGPLHIFRKTSQTLVFWQDGSLVYGLTATLPGEQTIGLARRLVAGDRRTTDP